MAIQWNDALLVHVFEIDTQHKKLVEMVNELDAAMRVGKGRQAIGTVLASLVQYTRHHFATEEKLMAAHRYPEAPKHGEEHHKLTHTVVDFKTQFDAGNQHLTIPIMKFLEDWLTNHILNTDKNLGRFLNTHGIK